MAVKVVAMISGFTYGGEDNLVIKANLSTGQNDAINVPFGPYAVALASEITFNNTLRADMQAYAEANMAVVFNVGDTLKLLHRVSLA